MLLAPSLTELNKIFAVLLYLCKKHIFICVCVCLFVCVYIFLWETGKGLSEEVVTCS